MSAQGFCYLATAEKGLATLECDGQRFVPLFTRTEDLLAFCGRCKEQLAGYALHVVTDGADATGFLAALADLGLLAGLSDAAREDASSETKFAVMEPHVLARAFADPGSA